MAGVGWGGVGSVRTGSSSQQADDEVQRTAFPQAFPQLSSAEKENAEFRCGAGPQNWEVQRIQAAKSESWV